MSVLFALPRPIPERGGEPKIRLGELARARQREAEQRIDALKLEIGRIARGGPPDVGARLEYDGRRIGRMTGGETGEVGGGAREVSAIQGIETRPQGSPIGGSGGTTLQDEDRGG